MYMCIYISICVFMHRCVWRCVSGIAGKADRWPGGTGGYHEQRDVTTSEASIGSGVELFRSELDAWVWCGGHSSGREGFGGCFDWYGRGGREGGSGGERDEEEAD